ncbi:hypothetical protein DNTS_015242 [Danionella cerebrum]|uniref:Carbohydrate kinase PfkB domain-containing protein n=1 Tax=Danionella cerebrum TaxID=2873325 RepID=A0A553MSG6_9TELE|nr:hypothetical protein DNTS_015242 [Danionella translucida]
MWKFVTFLRRNITTSSCRRCKQDSLFTIHPHVKEALADHKPVVALESTIITHGMPYPYNFSTAKEVEAIVRAEGAIPATVGILEGRIHVGLSTDELDFLAQSKTAQKVSRRDLPYVISQGLSGGTTVSGTMIAAHKAGIPVFVTGGIGGVHRDGENTLDVSADLTELGRTPIAVVSAGVKSILDIGRTLEFLVSGNSRCVCSNIWRFKKLPGVLLSEKWIRFSFPRLQSSRSSRFYWQVSSSTLSLGLQSGLLFAVPIPEEHAATGQQIEEAIQTAVAEASLKGVMGRDVTPFILQRVNELTKGKSLQANIALIHNNAKVGSWIACALAERSEKHGNSFRGVIKNKKSKEQKMASRAVVIGGINVDFIAKGTAKELVFGQTNPGVVCQSFGGVGRNIADCLSRLGCKPLFISAIGKDSHSEAVLNYCKHMDTSAVARLQDQRTATYCAVITESGELSLGLGDMDIHQQIQEQYVSEFEDQLSSASLIICDGNIPVSTIDYICCVAKQHTVPVWFEPTDTDKACKPFLSESWKALAYASPNLSELCTINRTLQLPTPSEIPRSLEDVLSWAVALSRPLLAHLQCVMKGQLCAVHYPALPVRSEETVNVSGAGDSFAAAVMVGILQGLDTQICVQMGLLAARFSLLSTHPIDQSLTLDTVLPDAFCLHQSLEPRCVWMED